MKSDRDVQIPYDIAYIWTLKIIDINELIYKSEKRLRLRDESMVTKGEGWMRVDWEFGVDMFTLLHSKSLINKHREFCSIFCNKYGKELEK